MTEDITHPSHVTPEKAWQMMQADTTVLLIDVRSDMEFLMIGHPVSAVNIAWIDHPQWTVNNNFVADVRKLMLGRVSSRVPGGASLLLICRSGNRSSDAAQALISDGIENIYIVSDGFEGPLNENRHRNKIAGWRHAGLPWEQC